MIKHDFVYDIEIFPNLFLIVFKNIRTGEFFIFEISARIDDRHRLVEFLKNVGILIGFNNVLFDYPLLHEFIRLYRFQRNMKGSDMVKKLYDKAQKLISQGRSWSRIRVKPLIPQVDLFLINHYDNYAKSTSLKVLEFNLKMDNIQNLPYAFNNLLTEGEIDNVIIYCRNDVNTTHSFLLENKKSIAFRNRMSHLYKHDFTNYNDVKIGEEILLSAVAKGMDVDKIIVRKMRTKRTIMKMSDIILPYVRFDSIEFKALMDWWKEKEIEKTRGQFTEIPMDEVTPLLPFCNNKKVKGKLKNLNIIFKNFQFDFGTGGLHGVCHPGIFKTDNEYEIILVDVKSYYPNLASKNNFHPEHIPWRIFKTVIDKLYALRMKAREEGDEEMVGAIKLALNGALYGKSNSPYSFMYDPQFMMSICVNGQLLLSMFAEKCMIAGMQLIQVNTDGVMLRLKRDQRYKLDEIVEWWTKLTRLEVEYDHFDIVVQRDVNNYLAQYTNGYIKYKGVFDYHYTRNREFHKNYSMLIVPKALEAYYLKGIEPEEFVSKHGNMYDFFKRTKYGKDSRLVMEDNQQLHLLQNTTRYYVADDGYVFKKIMPPIPPKTVDREFAVESGYRCVAVNNMETIDMVLMKDNINHMYYVDKIRQIINLIES